MFESKEQYLTEVFENKAESSKEDGLIIIDFLADEEFSKESFFCYKHLLSNFFSDLFLENYVKVHSSELRLPKSELRSFFDLVIYLDTNPEEIIAKNLMLTKIKGKEKMLNSRFSPEHPLLI